MSEFRRQLISFLKYTLVNGIILIFNFLLYIIFIELFHVWYIVSNIFSYIIAVVISFFLNKLIVFKQNTKVIEVIEFLTMKLIVGVLSTIMLWVLVDYGGINRYLGSLFVTGFFFVISYFLSRMIFIFQSKIKDLFELLRIRHWIKNVLIFLPAIGGTRFLTNSDYLKICVILFIGMCFLASDVYIMNDISDYEGDLHNPRKQEHPLVKGQITTAQALGYFFMCLLFFLISLYLLYVLLDLKIWFKMFILMLVYLLINIGYSILGMKNIPVLELLVLVLGYVVRLEAGGGWLLKHLYQIICY